MKYLRSELTKKGHPILMFLILMMALLLVNLSLTIPAYAKDPGALESEEEVTLSTLQDTIIEASEKVASAVVNITTVRLIPDFFFNIVPQEGQGSGVIFDRRGYILTNEHVIHRAKEIKVLLTDGREFPGQLVGSDSRMDLAVIKIEARNLPLAKLGDSQNLRVGEFCIAIGNPFGLQNTVTLGVISATNRSIRAEPTKILENLIQTDAAINPGNSGGPLINFKGEVIGINTAIIPYAQGIGFAIPINDAKEIAPELIEYGRIIRPWLGIQYLPLTPQVISRFRLTTESGIYVVSVISGGPADKAGLKSGDIIKRLDSWEVKTADDLRNFMAKVKVGDRIALTILRDEQFKVIEVVLEEMPQR